MPLIAGNNNMPYPAVEFLPSAVRAHLPPHAQEIYRSAFNNAWDRYADYGEEREGIAHRVAWAAVKRSYRRTDYGWVPRT
jgi:cation transport regulator